MDEDLPYTSLLLNKEGSETGEKTSNETLEQVLKKIKGLKRD
jgi:hypothetical protein